LEVIGGIKVSDVPIVLLLIYGFICLIAGNIWFNWKVAVVLILVEFAYDMMMRILK